jgi:hypothetical protein
MIRKTLNASRLQQEFEQLSVRSLVSVIGA